MELWIRSQKNEKLRDGLYKVKEIEIGDYDEDMDCLVANNLYCIGVYKSKERALEVLNEIQNILQPRVIWREPKTDIKFDENYFYNTAKDMVIQTTQQVEYDLKQAGQIVYEMPKE